MLSGNWKRRWAMVVLTAGLSLGNLAANAGFRPNPVLAAHAGDFVSLKSEKLVPYDPAQFLKARYTVLYFGAGWCPDCRRFSPKLVEAYDHQTAGGKAFEVLLLSRDKNAEGMLNFMKTERMTWPALAFEKLNAATDLARFYSGHGIPCLTVIDGEGKVVLQSKSDQDGADVLNELLKLPGMPEKK